ncbi:hypothetical protein M5X04_25910 [Paenibacillus alvei]|uniref:Uncharacterized protein n=1 Tax=Paenibacillus alvei TaxID=44250 RepID=A0ABT4EG92_PAEAL|nr:hypothetical protein [Paenibacillus alvei]MCY9532749.1 hypothetical protein [Paenibacillus alvei]
MLQELKSGGIESTAKKYGIGEQPYLNGGIVMNNMVIGGWNTSPITEVILLSSNSKR